MTFLQRLRQAFAKCDRLQYIVWIGIAGMLLILGSSVFSQDDATEPQPSAVSQSPAPSEDDYRLTLEQRLTDLLSHMDGVGDVQVMVTISGSAEQIYAQEVKQSQSEHTSQSEHEVVLTRVDGDESPLIAKTQYPQVQGIAILCTGGDSPIVQERILHAVSALLDLPANAVYVGKGNPADPSKGVH